jgi:hypothetical protein
MKYSREYRPQDIASRGEFRDHLHGVFLDKDSGVLVSTDGRAMMTVPAIHCDSDVGGMIPTEAFDKADESGIRVTKNAAVVSSGGSTTVIKRPKPSAPFPDWKAACPSVKRGDSGTITIAINATLLNRLASAIGADEVGGEVTLTFSPQNYRQPMLVMAGVEKREKNDATGWIMPCANDWEPGKS